MAIDELDKNKYAYMHEQSTVGFGVRIVAGNT